MVKTNIISLDFKLETDDFGIEVLFTCEVHAEDKQNGTGLIATNQLMNEAKKPRGLTFYKCQQLEKPSVTW